MHVNEAIGPVHNSHLTRFRQCGQAFKYSFIENIQSRRPGLPLARGIWLHFCLEAQFLKWGLEDDTLLQVPDHINVDGVGIVHVVAEENLYLVLDSDATQVYPLSAGGMLALLTEHVWRRLLPGEQEKYTEDDHTLPEACDRILTEYFYYWKDTPRPKILLVEVEWRREYDGVEFEGRTDYVIQRENGLIVCGDWKSTKRQPHAKYKFMESQLNLYPWGIAPLLLELGVDEKAVKSMAVEFDYLSTKLPTIPSINKDGSMSKRKINTTKLTLIKFLKEHGLKWSMDEVDAFLLKNEREFFIRKTLPRDMKVVKTLMEDNVVDAQRIGELVSNPDTATRTVTQDCDWRCDFIELCMGELYHQDVRYLRKTQFETRTNSHYVGDSDDDD